MIRFQYEITTHSADTFRELVYFCSQEGTCNLESIRSDQLELIQKILNDKGKEGWELVQVSFGKDGMLVFWRRMIKED